MNESALPNPQRHTYTLPDTSRQLATDPKTVTFKLITLAEESKAEELAKSLKTNLAFEKVKQALVEVDGKPLTWDGGAKEQFIEACSPKVRELLVKGFIHSNRPSDQDEADFLASSAASV